MASSSGSIHLNAAFNYEVFHFVRLGSCLLVPPPITDSEAGGFGEDDLRVTRDEGWGREDEPKKEADETVGGDGHTAGGSFEAWVKHSRTSAGFGLSFGFSARHRSTMSQTAWFGNAHSGRSSLVHLEAKSLVTRRSTSWNGCRPESTCRFIECLLLVYTTWGITS